MSARKFNVGDRVQYSDKSRYKTGTATVAGYRKNTSINFVQVHFDDLVEEQTQSFTAGWYEDYWELIDNADDFVDDLT